MAGFVALLGFSQRQIQASFDPKLCRSQHRNRIPVEAKNLGDWLHLKRIAANLSQAEVAELIGVSERLVQAWERNRVVPTSEYCARLGVLPGIIGTALPAQLAAD